MTDYATGMTPVKNMYIEKVMSLVIERVRDGK